MDQGIREEWTKKDRPCVNQWYRVKGERDRDYWKITKDFYSPQLNTTFYKIVEYFNSDYLYVGKTLAQCREILKDNTYKKAV